ncbi:DUF4336 domain-containing protein [Bradyrhizobium cenepequi]|uniref:DUF4336 domain-containing protein n=1 Tax=Bradyrhizobium cenepequi TaxID=2821403 RepID=UPI001CE2E0AE|nr:DUF4336 domain-containing protein [Bradyrhizobium cenepequi]MCA6111967.1 DUF4336 domain-containing protein [Bradyrhizobium cenepequi]
MLHEDHLTYPPLNTLKQVAGDVWIIDGPAIQFGPFWFKAPFPTRATIFRLAGGNLFVHSPTPLVPELKAEIDRTGVPRWIIGPNRLHYWWIPDWRAAYPDARVFLAPKTRQQAGSRLDLDCETLDRTSGYPWDDRIATLPIAGSYMTEVAFFHRSSRTLVLTDLIENFEARKVEARLMRFLICAGGVRDPNGSTPRDMRLSFWRNKAAVKAAVQVMIDWDPERIILAHGRWYDHDGRAELQRAFRWILLRQFARPSHSRA